jgi:hypothetical protein
MLHLQEKPFPQASSDAQATGEPSGYRCLSVGTRQGKTSRLFLELVCDRELDLVLFDAGVEDLVVKQ